MTNTISDSIIIYGCPSPQEQTDGMINSDEILSSGFVVYGAPVPSPTVPPQNIPYMPSFPKEYPSQLTESDIRRIIEDVLKEREDSNKREETLQKDIAWIKETLGKLVKT